jgi:tetratricopeptide (TPR) repeat protein
MKKKLLMLLGLMILTSAINTAYSKVTVNSDLATAIKMYKAGNYSECYLVLGKALEADPSNPLAYYYMGMTSAQLGKKDEAISNYEKVLELSPENNNLSRYANKGKRCIETPDKCQESLYESIEDEFIQSRRGPRYTDNVRQKYENLKIENLMREINRNGDIEPTKFKEYKDFSSMNFNETPSNEDIVAALRTLQAAGLSSYTSATNPDLALLTGSNDMMNPASMSPQVIQTLLTNSFMQGF